MTNLNEISVTKQKNKAVRKDLFEAKKLYQSREYSKSLEIYEYYADPRNQFWQIIYAVYNEPVDCDYSNRCKFLLDHKLVVHSINQFKYFVKGNRNNPINIS